MHCRQSPPKANPQSQRSAATAAVPTMTETIQHQPRQAYRLTGKLNSRGT